MVEALSGALLQLEQLPPGSIVLRPNIGLSGVVTEHQVEHVRAAGVSGSVHGALQALVEHALQPGRRGAPPVAGWTARVPAGLGRGPGARVRGAVSGA